MLIPLLVASTETLAPTDFFQIGSYTDGTQLASALYDQLLVFDRALTINEVEDLITNYGQVAGTRVQVRKRNDPEPVLNLALTL